MAPSDPKMIAAPREIKSPLPFMERDTEVHIRQKAVMTKKMGSFDFGDDTPPLLKGLLTGMPELQQGPDELTGCKDTTLLNPSGIHETLKFTDRHF